VHAENFVARRTFGAETLAHPSAMLVYQNNNKAARERARACPSDNSICFLGRVIKTTRTRLAFLD